MTVPSEKAARYDRQLRLWGDHGQAALESAHICLINASATGCEIVKNLVLPGIGAFTVLDKKRVTLEDLGSNFFVAAEDVGSPRGKCAMHLLQELNCEVKGSFVDDDFVTAVSTTPDFFTRFTLVVATELPESDLLKLADLLWKASIPLVVARSYGLLGYIRIALPGHEVIESHPDNYHQDLRLDCPFPQLVQYMDSINLDGMDNTKHLNVPYLVILYKFLQKWRQSNGGEIPKNYREKKEFKKFLKTGIRKNDEGFPLDEENFDEAEQNVNSIILPTQIPSAVKAILDDPACTYVTPDSSNFWLLARAVREFVAAEGDGSLPLRGSIPDMTSSSDMYVELSKVYQAKAKEDMEAVAGHLSQLLESIGRPNSSVPEAKIRRFCRNSAFLRVLRYNSIAKELEVPNLEELRMHLDNPDSELVYYVLLRAGDQFYGLYNSFPGQKESDFESDVAKLKSIVVSLFQRWGLSSHSIRDEHTAEFCRYSGAELHSVAAFVGGIASQEVIKIVTRQFVPLNNTFLYSGATSTSLSVAL